MLGHRLQRHVERLGQFGHGLLRARDSSQDCTQGGLSERPKNAVEVIVPMLNHKVEYQALETTVNQLSIETGHARFAVAHSTMPRVFCWAMAYDMKLAERIRRAVAGRRGVTEKAMFGGLAFLLDGKVFCRVDPWVEAGVTFVASVQAGSRRG
jgi:hypothetical protein